jgi:hypothetical protein
MEPLEYIGLLVAPSQNHISWRTNTTPESTIRINMHRPTIQYNPNLEDYLIRLGLYSISIMIVILIRY